MKNNRVLVISNMYPSKKSVTFGIFVKNQVDALQRAEFHVDVLAITNPGTKKQDVVSKYLLWILKGVFLLLKGYKYDIIHAHYVFPSGLIGILFKLFWKSKLVVTAHGGDINKMAKKNRLINKLTTQILHKADFVITVGHGLYQELKDDYRVDINKMKLLSMGVNSEIFRNIDDKDGLKKKLSIGERERVILYVGNVIRDKGLVDLIKAFSEIKAQNPNAVLHIIGSTKSKAFSDELRSIIEEESITGITFHKPKTQQEIAEWMNTADVFVLPSYIEGFGLVALEAMACGTPVVASNVGGLSFLLNNGCGLLVPPADHYSLSEGIIRVLSNKDISASLIENGTKRAVEHDQKNVIEQIGKVYRL